MIKKIEVWETSDGEVFHNKEEAEDYEEKTSAKEAIRDFCGAHCWRSMTVNDMSDIIYENREELQEILNDK